MSETILEPHLDTYTYANVPPIESYSYTLYVKHRVVCKNLSNERLSSNPRRGLGTLGLLSGSGLSYEGYMIIQETSSLPEKPNTMPERVWSLIGICLNYHPKQRPTMGEALTKLSENM